MNLYGWKAIIDALGLPGRVVKHLVDHEGLPVIRAGKTIFTSRELLDLWMTSWLKRYARNQVTESIVRKMHVKKDPAYLEAVELLSLAAEARKRGLWDGPPEDYKEAGKRRADSYRKIVSDVRRFPE